MYKWDWLLTCRNPAIRKKMWNFEEFTQPPNHTFLCPTYLFYGIYLTSLIVVFFFIVFCFLSRCLCLLSRAALDPLAALDFRLVPLPPLPLVFFPVVTWVMMLASHWKAVAHLAAVACCPPISLWSTKLSKAASTRVLLVQLGGNDCGSGMWHATASSWISFPSAVSVWSLEVTVTCMGGINTLFITVRVALWVVVICITCHNFSI